MTNNPHDFTGKDPTKSGVARIIEWSVSNQLLVMVGALALVIAGWLAIQKIPLDAIPDMSDTQVIIRRRPIASDRRSSRDLPVIDHPARTTTHEDRAGLLHVRDELRLCNFRRRC